MDVRPTNPSFPPTMWGDTSTSFSLDDKVQEKYAEAIEALKEEARSMLMAKGNTTADRLILIDTLERLGVAYHFEQEIEDQLQDIFRFHSTDENDYDLFTTALQFRLLRQHRHFVSCSVFDKFKDKDNKFEESLSNDAKGMLSLYEAAHVRIHGEDILEEAVAFTTYHLKRMVQQLESPLQDQVRRALEQPLHRGNFYKKELHDLSRWWNEFDLKSKLPYTRDRLVEAYFWGVALHFKPQDSYARVGVGKSVQLAAVINDTYDRYATLEEADIFTEIVESVSFNAFHPSLTCLDRTPNAALSTRIILPATIAHSPDCAAPPSAGFNAFHPSLTCPDRTPNAALSTRIILPATIAHSPDCAAPPCAGFNDFHPSLTCPDRMPNAALSDAQRRPVHTHSPTRDYRPLPGLRSPAQRRLQCLSPLPNLPRPDAQRRPVHTHNPTRDYRPLPGLRSPAQRRLQCLSPLPSPAQTGRYPLPVLRTSQLCPGPPPNAQVDPQWDVNEINRLPDYMKIVYKFILSIYVDYEIEASKQGKPYAVSYAKETVKQLCKAYDKVQKWTIGQQIPTFEEYVANMMFTSCIYLLLASTIPGVKSASKDTIDLLTGDSKFVAASAKIGRYSNDLGSYERENKGGSLPKAVRCYMKQYGVSEEEALDKFVELVEDAWKDVNTGWITETPRDMAEQLLNYARVSEVTYKNNQDGFSNPERYMAPQLVALFVDPILI
ncbi:Gamma-cadinene synthase [Sesamum alatum]|uniref:Gamma-cadinene synthase n=1 Tax=Sesamum alatum TaxID=300844 RepID=A0AAE1XXU9_9LAMI|nr:Gamma-cadinene synthase [Sesamum alatum]